jgi:hypothetical protein
MTYIRAVDLRAAYPLQVTYTTAGNIFRGNISAWRISQLRASGWVNFVWLNFGWVNFVWLIFEWLNFGGLRTIAGMLGAYVYDLMFRSFLRTNDRFWSLDGLKCSNLVIGQGSPRCATLIVMSAKGGHHRREESDATEFFACLVLFLRSNRSRASCQRSSDWMRQIFLSTGPVEQQEG